MILNIFSFEIFLFTLTVGAIYLSGPSLSLVLSRIKDGVFFGCNLRPRLINFIDTHHIPRRLQYHVHCWHHPQTLHVLHSFTLITELKIFQKNLFEMSAAVAVQPFFCWPTVSMWEWPAGCLYIFTLIRQRRRNRVIIWWKYFSFIRSHWTNVKILQYPHMALSV